MLSKEREREGAGGGWGMANETSSCTSCSNIYNNNKQEQSQQITNRGAPKIEDPSDFMPHLLHIAITSSVLPFEVSRAGPCTLCHSTTLDHGPKSRCNSARGGLDSCDTVTEQASFSRLFMRMALFAFSPLLSEGDVRFDMRAHKNASRPIMGLCATTTTGGWNFVRRSWLFMSRRGPSYTPYCTILYYDYYQTLTTQHKTLTCVLIR